MAVTSAVTEAKQGSPQNFRLQTCWSQKCRIFWKKMEKSILGWNNLRLKGEGNVFSKALVSAYKSTQHYNPADQRWHLHCHENIKSHVLILHCSLWQTIDTTWCATHHLTIPTVHATSTLTPLTSTAWLMTWSRIPSMSSLLRLSRWGS